MIPFTSKATVGIQKIGFLSLLDAKLTDFRKQPYYCNRLLQSRVPISVQGQCDANVNTWGNEGAHVGPMLQNFVGCLGWFCDRAEKQSRPIAIAKEGN